MNGINFVKPPDVPRSPAASATGEIIVETLSRVLEAMDTEIIPSPETTLAMRKVQEAIFWYSQAATISGRNGLATPADLVNFVMTIGRNAYFPGHGK